MKYAIAAVFSLLCSAPVYAHPHIFIDTGLRLVYDATGRLSQVEVTWAYDALYSLLVTEDYQLDTDHDGFLTESEIEQITGFDMNWIDGFNGDLEVFQGDRLLSLSGPRDYTARFEDGRVITTHVRDVGADHTPGEAFTLLPYDATYYTAYDVTLGVEIVSATPCGSKIELPEVSAGLEDLRQQLSALDPDIDPADAGFPEIGAQLASKVKVACD